MQRNARRAGQAMVESAFVIVVACLIFFGLLQLSRLYAAQAVATYAATAGARARMVGFNDFMVHKVVRVAAIPNAGRMTEPVPPPESGAALWGSARPGALWDRAVRTRSPQPAAHAIERSRIPLYLATQSGDRTSAVLDYEFWPTLRHSTEEGGGVLLRMRVTQAFPLTVPFRPAFYADDHVRIRSGSAGNDYAVTREVHYPVYLQ